MHKYSSTIYTHMLIPPLPTHTHTHTHTHTQSLDLAWQATRELKHSKQFVDVLCYVLAAGNYLNAGSRQGGAYGFRLSILPKVSLLSQTRQI